MLLRILFITVYTARFLNFSFLAETMIEVFLFFFNHLIAAEKYGDVIEKYNIDLVVIGNLERNKYPSSGINKIETLDNVFEEIYKNDQTTILKAIK